MSIVNISSYKFVPLQGLPKLKDAFLQVCTPLGIRGTILLSSEGINIMLAGSRQAIDAFVDFLGLMPDFADTAFKESLSAEQPFKRLCVKLKAEIITMGRPEIDPYQKPALRISAETFKQWLDEGREITILDTRNDYEVEYGTFVNAIDLGIESFTQFPLAAAEHLTQMKDKPVVMFCTGGVRCEKAGPFLMAQGFKEIYQLDGGILKYFEKCGGAHYDGNCFVFDERIMVDPQLAEVN